MNDLENFCSVKEKHFDDIFKEYFRTKDITSYIKCDRDKLYSKYEVIKIHLHKPDNIDDFLYNIFKHIITFSGQDYGTLAKTKKVKYEKSIGVLTKYLDILKNKNLDELKEGENIIKRKNKETSYFIDSDLESLNKQRELGEIILFFLTEGLLKAPVAISKVKLKTSNQMPVYGADGVHISNDGEKLIFGESKLTDNFENGKKAGLDSMIKFSGKTPLNYILEEINIIGNNFLGISKKKGNILEQIVNPYYSDKKDIELLKYELTCFIGYKDESYINFLQDNNKNKYDIKLNSKIISLLKSYKSKENELKSKKITFFLLPVTDIFELLKKYGLKIREEEKNNKIINSN